MALMTQIAPRPPRLSAETWSQAREDYLAGASTALIAERYGTTDRSVRRRAALEGWRRPDFMPSQFGGPPPPWMAGPRTKEQEIEAEPALEEVDDAQASARFGLLFNPVPRTLRHFAFRQAAENAAIDRPQQAVAWMRLLHMAERSGERIESDSRAFRDIDHIRAAYLRQLNAAVAEGREEVLAEEAEANRLAEETQVEGSDVQQPPPPT